MSGIRKPLEELVSDEDAMDLVRAWARASEEANAIIPATPVRGQRTLEALQVSTRSPLGALALHTGGITLAHGWLRVWGSGSAEVPRALDTWNEHDGARRCEHGLLVADDVVGGFFAWFSNPRTIHYLAPDTLAWEDLGLGYADWLSWCFTDRLGTFYESLRWPGWEQEVKSVPGERGLHFVPPLWAKGPQVPQRSRRAVLVEELWSLAIDTQRALG